MSQAALQAVEAAKVVARQSGLPEKVAVSEAIRGAVEAAESLNPETVSEVRKALPEELLSALPPESEQGGKSKKDQDASS